MKHIVLAMLYIAMGFTCVAQDNKEITNKDVNEVKAKLEQVLIPMREKAENLLRDINSQQAICDKLKDRIYDVSSFSSQGNVNLEEYLAGFSTLKEMFKEDSITHGGVLEQINNSANSDLKSLYQLIFAMNQSLSKPYDEASNNQYIKEASNNTGILPKHKPEFDSLVSKVNDYNYYMYELARLFEAAKEDNFQKEIGQLVKDEDATELLAVPYTAETLKTFFEDHKKHGDLSSEKKKELKTACPNAFPDF